MKLPVNKTIVVVSRIANSHIEQAVIVIVIVVYKFEQWHKSLIETKLVFVFTWFDIHELIFKRF